MSASKESTGTLGNLANIPKLESTAGWINWSREMKDHLTMSGYGDLFKRNKDKPTGTSAATVEKIDNWLSKQERACGAVLNRLGYNAREQVKDKETVTEIFSELEKRFKPKGSAVFQELDRRYNSLTLDQCSGVMNFAERLREAQSELLQLDETCKIGTPQFINKFLTGLGPEYEVFLTAFYQNHNLLPERGSNGEVTKPAVTFEIALTAAEQEEMNIQQREKTKTQQTALLAGTRGLRKDRVTQTCDHCNKPGHNKAGCFGLHPDLLEEFRRKRALRSERRETKLERRKENSSSLQPDEDHTAAIAFLNTAFLSLQPQFGLAASEPSKLLERIHVLDSGASSHTFCHRRNFTSLEKFTGSAINGIAGSAIMPEGQGTYTLKTIWNNTKGRTAFHKALYVPGAHCNLISVSVLEEDGATILFRKGRAVVTNHGKVILSATRKFGLYVIDEDDEQLHTAMAAYSVSDPKLQIWHDRLGHLGEQNLH
ncbi:Retrovirus-related Pol polyprotein from transposon TNT [Fusarium oxysporum f. sp. raphani]|uniref:Retrovirus-related Pol polyprotein from transposon TNT n=1 Tax=Fusarium oxysporum f. sp. raphani TaxID=96318 RepID=A0A8J5PPI3_FUSOX|nr:Retrovirus-related Pol polyprotein from transposon TNT [Fusarium oxysporum f. sp. raphani]